ncbi:MAG: hypothetical protein ACRDO9_02840, partial [Gaiellales bacterium]
MRRHFAPIVVAAVALAFAGCGGDENGTTTTASPPPPSPATPPPSSQPPPPPPPKPQVTTVRIVVRGGKVIGGLERATVEQGEKVAIVVGSDVADEVHLHGYDKSNDIAPGKQARLVFVASIPGRFEVELEDRGLQ